MKKYLLLAVLLTGCTGTKALKKEIAELKLDVEVLTRDNDDLRKKEDAARRKAESYNRIIKMYKLDLRKADQDAEGK